MSAGEPVGGDTVAPPLPSQPAALSRLPDRAAASGWTAARKRAFVEHLAVNGCVSLAAAHVGLSRQSAYQQRHRYPNSMFVMAWKTAMMLAHQSLMEIATERAINGRELEIWSRNGELIGTRTVHNDRLLMAMVRYKPEPVHPHLSPDELQEMWSAMLDHIDETLPPVLSEEGARIKLEELRAEGNDER